MKPVRLRIALLAALFSSALSAQFFGLSSTADGSSLQFRFHASTEGLAQAAQRQNFRSHARRRKPFRARESAAPPANSPNCTAGGFAEYLGAEASSTGAVALSYRSRAAGTCSSGSPSTSRRSSSRAAVTPRCYRPSRRRRSCARRCVAPRRLHKEWSGTPGGWRTKSIRGPMWQRVALRMIAV